MEWLEAILQAALEEQMSDKDKEQERLRPLPPAEAGAKEEKKEEKKETPPTPPRAWASLDVGERAHVVGILARQDLSDEQKLGACVGIEIPAQVWQKAGWGEKIARAGATAVTVAAGIAAVTVSVVVVVEAGRYIARLVKGAPAGAP